MGIRHVVFNTLAASLILRERIANRLGYPKEGTNIGRGYFAHPDQSRTLHHVFLRKHPSQNKWAIVVDDTARGQLRNGVDVEEDLTSDWNDPRPN